MYDLEGRQKAWKDAAYRSIDGYRAQTAADDQQKPVYRLLNGCRPGLEARSPLRSSARIGDPVRIALSFGRYFKVSGKLQQTFAAEGIQILFASPGVISDSWIMVGIL